MGICDGFGSGKTGGGGNFGKPRSDSPGDLLRTAGSPHPTNIHSSLRKCSLKCEGVF